MLKGIVKENEVSYIHIFLFVLILIYCSDNNGRRHFVTENVPKEDNIFIQGPQFDGMCQCIMFIVKNVKD